MKFSTALILIAFAMLFITGCKKSDDTNSIDSSQLTGKNWVKTAETASPAVDFDNDGDLETNIFPLLSACETDNYFNFSTSGILTFNEGALKCDTASPQTFTGTWAWNAGNTKFTVVFGSSPKTISIVMLNSSTLVIQESDTVGGIPFTDKQTLMAQ